MIIIKIITVFLLFTDVSGKKKQTLRLGVLISQETVFDFTGFIPTMNIALETINNDATLPFNFSISLNDSDSRVSKLIYIYTINNIDDGIILLKKSEASYCSLKLNQMGYS